MKTENDGQKQEQMSQEDYLKELSKRGLCVCPQCQGENVNIEAPCNRGDHLAYSYGTCIDCHFQWTIVFAVLNSDGDSN
jgi:hypothetical protein